MPMNEKETCKQLIDRIVAEATEIINARLHSMVR